MINDFSDKDKKRTPVIIKELLENFLKDHNQQKETPQAIILKNWEKIISRQASLESMPVVIKNKTLIVIVSNSGLLHYLTLKKKEIQENIERILNTKAVKDIRFKIGEVNIK